MYNSDLKEKMVNVFQDTEKWYSTNPELQKAVEYSRQNTRLYKEGNDPEIPVLGTLEELTIRAEDSMNSIGAAAAADFDRSRLLMGYPSRDPGEGRVMVTDRKTFETAMELIGKYPGKKTAVLNFASATRPGGGVKQGSRAQEESLCRCSTLYPTLDRKWLYDEYYTVNRNRGDVRYSDACIYSPGVIICKTDDDIPVRMEEKEWKRVDVISCAAPNLRAKPSNKYNPGGGKPMILSDDALYELHLKRARHIFRVAAANHVDMLVLGAFGCGAFENNPEVVASVYSRVTGEFRGYFDVIAYAVYCTPKDRKNYNAFKQQLGGMENKEELSDKQQAADEIFMKEVLELADIAAEHGERPYAAMLVGNNHVLVKNVDRRESSNDISAHAVFTLLIKASKHYNINDFSEFTLYTNCEPCFMCCSLIKQYKLGRLVYGTSEIMASSADHSEGSYPVKMVFRNRQWPTKIKGGILAGKAQEKIESWMSQNLKMYSLR